eukprot:jgi/Picsp_1/5544/NSC_02903-R1_beta-lactamase
MGVHYQGVPRQAYARQWVVLASTIVMCTVCASGREGAQKDLEQLDRIIKREMEVKHLPSVSAVIVKDGTVVWMKSFGLADVQATVPATPETVYLTASVSKIFTAHAVMQLVEDGEINLDQDINDYVPLTIRNPRFPSKKITARNLLTHTSSIRDNHDVMDTYYEYGRDPSLSLSDCMEAYFSKDTGDDYSMKNYLGTPPGTAAEYSNMGFALLGYLVQVVSGTSFDVYSQQNIFGPICMNNTYWMLSPFKNHTLLAKPYWYKESTERFVAYDHYTFADYPDGAVRTSIDQMSNYLITFLNGGTYPTSKSQILKSSTIREMLKPQIPSIESTQGLCWYKETFRPDDEKGQYWSHNGGESGVSTDVVLLPKYNAGVAAFSNGEEGLDTILNALLSVAKTISSVHGIPPSSCCADTCLTSNTVVG